MHLKDTVMSIISSSQSILIVTQTFDPHADELLVLLRYMGQEPIRVNTDAIPGDSLLSYTFARGADLVSDDSTHYGATPEYLAHYSLFLDGRLIEAQSVGSLWWRKPAPYQFIGTLQPEELHLATAETEQAMQGFWQVLLAQGCFWISPPASLARACNLPEQIRRARHYGFATPRSIITTQAEQMRTFYQETQGQMVYRMLSGLITPTDGYQSSTAHVSAVPVNLEQLALFETMVSIPCLFHERLPAWRFLFAVVIAGHVFVAQTTKEASFDQIACWWSPQICELPYEPAVISDKLVDRCRAFVQSYELSFGVIQFAYGPDEQLFFVSLDPSGSFLWLEQQCPTLHMSEALAQCLIDGNKAVQ